jgi:hypothetical protein
LRYPIDSTLLIIIVNGETFGLEKYFIFSLLGGGEYRRMILTVSANIRDIGGLSWDIHSYRDRKPRKEIASNDVAAIGKIKNSAGKLHGIDSSEFTNISDMLSTASSSLFAIHMRPR